VVRLKKQNITSSHLQVVSAIIFDLPAYFKKEKKKFVS